MPDTPDISLTTLFLLSAAVFGIGFSLGWMVRLSGLTITRKKVEKAEDAADSA